MSASTNPKSDLTPTPSALQTLLATSAPSDSHPPHLSHLALQVAHNLQHQHLWTNLHVHTHSPLSNDPLPRPMVSGLPPQRLYIHPDEQIALLQAQKAAGKTGLGDVRAEREWVLPSHLREKWSLRRFAEVFEGVGVVPPAMDGDEDEEEEGENKWRDKKRVVLATVDDDSTVVYYIVHDGIVKPRQN